MRKKNLFDADLIFFHAVIESSGFFHAVIESPSWFVTEQTDVLMIAKC